MILPSQTTLALGVALLASLGVNGFLGWQWAQSGAECDTDIAEKQIDSMARVGEAVVERNTISSSVTKDSDKRAAAATTDAEIAVQEAQETIRYVYLEAPADSSRDVGCTVVRPVADGVQHVIEAAASRANR